MSIKLNFNWQKYLIIGLLAAVIILAITTTYYHNKVATPAQIAATKIIVAHPKADIIKTFTDKQGLSHATIKADQNKVPAASLSDTVTHIKNVLDTVKQKLGLATVKQIEELTQEVVLLRARIKLLAIIDSSGNKTLSYADKWMHLSFNPADTMLDFHYDAKLTATRFFRYPIPFLHFIKSPEYIDFYSDDPRMTINGVNHLTFTQPAPLFGFSADARATYFINSSRLVPSVGADLRIGRFIFGAREFYSTKTNKLSPAVAMGYKFLQL